MGLLTACLLFPLRNFLLRTLFIKVAVPVPFRSGKSLLQDAAGQSAGEYQDIFQGLHFIFNKSGLGMICSCKRRSEIRSKQWVAGFEKLSKRCFFFELRFRQNEPGWLA